MQYNPISTTEEFDWDDLFDSLDAKDVIPIIGDELLIVKNPNSNENEFLYEYMHKELNKSLPEKSRESDFWEFMEKNKNTIPRKIRNFLNNDVEDKIILDSLKKLAQITDFEFYISMTYDNFLETTLKEERCTKGEQIETIDYSINNNSIKYSEEDLKTVATVFNLMGSIKKLNGFAKTEEEMLEHFYTLTKENQFNTKLFDNIEEKNLLFIGCKIPNGLFQFFIRIISRERLNEAHVTKIIADSKTPSNRSLCLFLNHFNSQIYPLPATNSMKFVDILYKKWKKRKPTTGKKKFQETVFLSFSSDDREPLVVELVNILDLNGVNVFYDKKKLDAGDYFDEKIKKEINKCELFVPLISENSLKPGRYARREWEAAMIREQYQINSGLKSNFIKPFIIDDTKSNEERIAEIFHHISVQARKDVTKIANFIIKNLTPLS